MASRFVVLCSILAVARAGVLSPVHYTATPSVAVAHKVAYANPAVDAVASTHQNVVRSYGGTVSTYSKAVDTPYSSVRKTDTRINNNVYTPAYEKTVAYAAPAPIRTIAYETVAPVAKTITYAAPVVQKAAVTYAAPVVSKTVYAAPAPAHAVYTHAAPAPAHAVYAHAAPVASNAELYTHAVPKTVVAPVSTYAVAKPAVSYAAPAPIAVAATSYNHGPAATTYTHNAPGVTGYGSSQTVHYSPANMVSHMSFDGFGTHWGY